MSGLDARLPTATGVTDPNAAGIKKRGEAHTPSLSQVGVQSKTPGPCNDTSRQLGLTLTGQALVFLLVELSRLRNDDNRVNTAARSLSVISCSSRIAVKFKICSVHIPQRERLLAF